MGRISAQERRQSVIRAAVAEFALRGYYGTSTESIAKRAGVAQPYLFRLFPGKRAIFAAALTRSMEDTRLAFECAAEGVEGSEQALQAMANAYAPLISEHPETLLMQMQGYALVAAAEARGDDQIGELVRAGWIRLGNRAPAAGRRCRGSHGLPRARHADQYPHGHRASPRPPGSKAVIRHSCSD